MAVPPEPAASGSGEDLARRLRAGDVHSLDPWYRAEHPRVYRLCLGFLADPEEAEDLAQDAMLHLQDHLRLWDARRPYEPWRSTVVLNLCRDRRRRLSARAHAEAQALPAGPAAHPEDQAQRAEVLEVLRAALVALPEREREAFVLHDLEGLATASAAEALGIHESSVRSLLTLARRRLRQILGPHLAVGESHG